MASTVIRSGSSWPVLLVTVLQSLRISRAKVPCTAKSHMMTPFFESPHHDSNRSRESPDCSMDGVAKTTHGPTPSNPFEFVRWLTWLNTNGLDSSNCAFMSEFKTLMYV